jgi:hypothetical protein
MNTLLVQAMVLCLGWFCSIDPGVIAWRRVTGLLGCAASLLQEENARGCWSLMLQTVLTTAGCSFSCFGNRYAISCNRCLVIIGWINTDWFTRTQPMNGEKYWVDVSRILFRLDSILATRDWDSRSVFSDSICVKIAWKTVANESLAIVESCCETKN